MKRKLYLSFLLGGMVSWATAQACNYPASQPSISSSASSACGTDNISITTSDITASVQGGSFDYLVYGNGNLLGTMRDTSGSITITDNALLAGYSGNSNSYTIIIRDHDDTTNQECWDTLQASITRNALPDVIASCPLSAACINSTAEITLYASGTTGNYSYAWSSSNGDLIPGQASPAVVAPLLPATVTYSLTVTDNTTGCKKTSSSSITYLPAPTMTITPSSTSVCELGESISLSASGAYTYSWSDGQTGAAITASPFATTVYSVTGTSYYGCTATSSQSITVQSAPAITITAPSSGVYCTSNGLQELAATPAGGVFSGATSGTSIAPYILGAGSFLLTYTCTIGGCSYAASQAITINDCGGITYDTVTTCHGESYNGHSGSGTYVDTLLASDGSDSVVVLALAIGDQIITSITHELMKGDSLVIGDTCYSAADTIDVLLSSLAGCDSTVRHIITISIAGDSNNNGTIDDTEIAGDVDNDGSISGGEICGDVNGNLEIDPGEVTGDINGNGVIDNTELKSSSRNEIAGDINGDGAIAGSEIAGDTDGNATIDNGTETTGDISGNNAIESTEILGDANANGTLDQGESTTTAARITGGTSLYPNPAGSTLTVETSGGATSGTVAIATILGNTVIEAPLATRGQTTLDLGALPAGVYTVVVRTSSGTLAREIVKE